MAPASSVENALSKSRTKAIWRENGISTPDWFTVRKKTQTATLRAWRSWKILAAPFHSVSRDREEKRRHGSQSIVRSPLELYSRASLVVDRYRLGDRQRFVAGDEDSREIRRRNDWRRGDSIVAAAEIRKARPDMPVITRGERWAFHFGCRDR